MAVSLLCDAGSQCFSQGLLGKKYLSVGYEAQRPHSESLREISNWSHGLVLQLNQPISDTIDLHVRLWSDSFDGEYIGFRGLTEMESSFTTLDLLATKHFRPFSNIDPYVSIGVQYFDGYVDIQSATLHTRSAGDNTGIGWRAGIEWRLTEYSAIQTEIRSSRDSFDDLDFDNLVTENLYFETKAIHWFNDRLLGGFTIGTDFDDTDVALGAFLGVSSY